MTPFRNRLYILGYSHGQITCFYACSTGRVIDGDETVMLYNYLEKEPMFHACSKNRTLTSELPINFILFFFEIPFYSHLH